MRNSRANLNLMAVSLLTRESAINTPQTLSHSLLVDVGDYLNLDVRRESNADEANGREEADLIYDNGATASGTLNFNRLQPHQAGLILAYGLGSVSTAAAGSGYAHTITPIDGDLDVVRPVVDQPEGRDTAGREAQVLRAVDRVGGVRDELAQEDLLLRVERIDDEVEHLLDLGLEQMVLLFHIDGTPYVQ